jgi:hypothetical protein
LREMNKGASLALLAAAVAVAAAAAAAAAARICTKMVFHGYQSTRLSVHHSAVFHFNKKKTTTIA